MANVVVVGAQWGDEGKGKIVDWLSERADIVARFQGGHNAGHTIVIDGAVYKLSLLPSGIVRGGKLSVIGNGVVLDPWHLVREVAALREKGVSISPDNLIIAENAPLILSIHGELDRARENQASVARIGTTGRGIGPAYEDKVGRRAIRVADLGDEETLMLRVDRLMVHHDALRRGLGIAPIDRDALLAELRAYPGQPPGEATTLEGEHPGVLMPFLIRTPVGLLHLISTTTVFGSPTDITLQELALETFFPGDRETAEALRGLASRQPPA